MTTLRCKNHVEGIHEGKWIAIEPPDDELLKLGLSYLVAQKCIFCGLFMGKSKLRIPNSEAIDLDELERMNRV